MSPTEITRIDWVRDSCRLLSAIRADFSKRRPFDGLTIGTGIHLEPKTAALLITLRAGGARVVASGNLSSTQPETVDYLRAEGVEVHAEQTTDLSRHLDCLRKVIDAKPELLLDNGGDLFALWLETPYPGLLGGTEETTSGRTRLTPLKPEIALPILVINDSPIKQFAENRHAVGQSMFESYMRLTNRSTNGKNVVVLGYGPCGEGVATAFRNAFAQVSVLEPDPVKRLEAHLDGFNTPPRETALSTADVIITETGAQAVINARDLPLFKDGALLMNGGHFPTEINVPALAAAPEVAHRETLPGTLETLHLSNGRRLHIVTQGHMANLAGPRPLGNSIESMDLGFALQSKCLERVATGTLGPDHCLIPVPRDIDEWVAEAFLTLP